MTLNKFTNKETVNINIFMNNPCSNLVMSFITHTIGNFVSQLNINIP